MRYLSDFLWTLLPVGIVTLVTHYHLPEHVVFVVGVAAAANLVGFIDGQLRARRWHR